MTTAAALNRISVLARVLLAVALALTAVLGASRMAAANSHAWTDFEISSAIAVQNVIEEGDLLIMASYGLTEPSDPDPYTELGALVTVQRTAGGTTSFLARAPVPDLGYGMAVVYQGADGEAITFGQTDVKVCLEANPTVTQPTPPIADKCATVAWEASNDMEGGLEDVEEAVLEILEDAQEIPATDLEYVSDDLITADGERVVKAAWPKLLELVAELFSISVGENAVFGSDSEAAGINPRVDRWTMDAFAFGAATETVTLSQDSVFEDADNLMVIADNARIYAPDGYTWDEPRTVNLEEAATDVAVYYRATGAVNIQESMTVTYSTGENTIDLPMPHAYLTNAGIAVTGSEGAQSFLFVAPDTITLTGTKPANGEDVTVTWQRPLPQTAATGIVEVGGIFGFGPWATGLLVAMGVIIGSGVLTWKLGAPGVVMLLPIGSAFQFAAVLGLMPLYIAVAPIVIVSFFALALIFRKIIVS